MHDLRHDPTIDPTAERTAFLRQWQPVPPGVKPWGRTVMHQEGNTYTNVDPPAKWQGSTRDDTPPAPEAPDLRTVGERVAECEQAIAALWDETGSESWNMRQLLGRVETLERSMRHAEALLHKALNPGEQEGESQPATAPDRAAILSDFYSEVCQEAEGIMAQSGMVSGAHWNAMRRVLQRHGVEVNE